MQGFHMNFWHKKLSFYTSSNTNMQGFHKQLQLKAALDNIQTREDSHWHHTQIPDDIRLKRHTPAPDIQDYNLHSDERCQTNQFQQEESHSYHIVLQFKCKAPLLLKLLTTLTNKATDTDLAEGANTPSVLLLKLPTPHTDEITDEHTRLVKATDTPYWRNQWWTHAVS